MLLLPAPGGVTREAIQALTITAVDVHEEA
jgi:hypothetical protein